MPKVSVIIPNYNHARFLDARIQSVLGQTFQDFEVLYLDDASTDHSAVVFAKYAEDPRIRTLLNTQNSGSPFKQWNKGVQAATGELIWIAEADDRADPRLLERLVGALDAHPNVGIAFCQSWIVDENDATDPQKPTMGCQTGDEHAERWLSDFVAHGPGEVSSALARRNIIPNASAVVFRKNIYRESGAAPEEYRACGDWLLWAKMLARTDLAYVAEPLNFFRIHSRSVTHGSRHSGLQIAENYAVIGWIRRHVSLTEPVSEQICESLMAQWMHLMWSPEAHIPWRRHVGIYHQARQADPRLHRRLKAATGPHLKYRIGSSLRQQSLLKPIFAAARGVKRLVRGHQ